MIISFHHQFIFVAIPKTASHSFRVALRPYLHKNDWEQCSLFEEKAFPIESLARQKHGHFSYEQVQPFLPSGVWDNFFNFCTVRNPYDRFVSHFFFRYRNSIKFRQDPLKVMKEVMQNPPAPFKPQHEYVSCDSGGLMVDYVARLENLQEDFDYICNKLVLPKICLKHINPAKHPPFGAALDEELVEFVKEYYAKDFELFEYSTNYKFK